MLELGVASAPMMILSSPASRPRLQLVAYLHMDWAAAADAEPERGCGCCGADGSAERSARTVEKVAQPQEVSPGPHHLGEGG